MMLEPEEWSATVQGGDVDAHFLETPEPPVAAPEHAATTPAPRALLEASDRHGNVQTRLAVLQWPVVVGRALSASLVLDDAYVAAEHLQLTKVSAGGVRAEVLGSINGVTLEGKHFASGEVFYWRAGQVLTAGRTQLHLRLGDVPVPPELPLPQAPWRTRAVTATGVVLMLILVTSQLWLRMNETSRFTQELPTTLLGVLAGLSAWAGAWALASKLFSAQPQFWRHVRIASALYLSAFVVDSVLSVLGFMFSWESLTRFDHLAALIVVAYGVFRHLLVVAPQRRKALQWVLVCAVALGLPTELGTEWLRTKRLSPQLYMSQLFPPGWRVVSPVPLEQFLQEAASIEKRLAVRLKDKEDDDNGPPAIGDD